MNLFQWFSHEKFRDFSIISKVARRSGYKGAMKHHEMRTLPVDSATAMGIVGIFGTILPATGLSAEALKSTVSVLDAMAEFLCINDAVPLVPENPAWSLTVTNNTVKSGDFERLLMDLRLNASRPGYQEHCH